MRTATHQNEELRALVRSALTCDHARIEQITRAGRRAGLDETDALVTAWLAAADPLHYSGTRGPQPCDRLLRAIQVEGERQAASAIDWDSSTPAALDAAELLREVRATGAGRERRRGTRPQAERRAAARRSQAAKVGQTGFAGTGWGIPA